MKLNPNGIIAAIMIPVIGYSFGGLTGLGIGCIIVIVINFS